MWKRMVLSVVLLAGMSAAMLGQATSVTVDNVKVTKFFNSDITAKDLKDKVVFVVYWGTH